MSKKMRQIKKAMQAQIIGDIKIPSSENSVKTTYKPKDTVFSIDNLQNMAANLGTTADKTTATSFLSNVYYNYAELSAVYSSWLGRRIVDTPVNEALKRGWYPYCPSWEPSKIQKMDAYTNMYLRLPSKIKSALKMSRVFGGSILVAMVDARWGSFKNPIPDFLPKNSLLCLQMFDAWQAYAAEMNFTNALDIQNYLYPESYTIGQVGMTTTQLPDASGNVESVAGAVVNHTRVERFDGLEIPWYDRMRNRYWGQSILGSCYEAVRNAGIVDSSIAGLIFRASVPVFKTKDLVNIVADPVQRQAFLERMNLLNYMMSNNNMAIIDAEEVLENLEANAANLDSILERYYVTCSSASGIPVAKLVGDNAKGLNASDAGSINNYYDMLEDYQNNEIKPHLLNIYRKWIIPSFFNELAPEDFDIRFPPIERVTPKEKQEQDSSFIDMLIKSKDAGFIDAKIARKEIVEKKIFNNLTQDEANRLETEKQENEVSLTQALDAADGIYNKPNPIEGVQT